MGFGLIPIGDGEKIVGAMIGVAVLDSGAEGLCERDRRIEMEAVDARTAAGKFGAFNWDAH